MTAIHITIGNGKAAQYDENQVKIMLEQGLLRDDALYWKEGMIEWKPLSSLFNNQPPSTQNTTCSSSIPVRLIILYILMCVRFLINLVGLIHSIPVQTYARQVQLVLSSIELCLSSFVIIMLFQKKYLSIQVFRPYIIISTIVAITLRSSPEKTEQMRINAIAHPFADLLGSALPDLICLSFWIWFGWYLTQANVKSYLSYSHLDKSKMFKSI